MNSDNPYVVLGLSESATEEEIAAKYRSLAREHHPDRNPNDPDANRRMQDINAAYQQLRAEEGRVAILKRLAEQRERERQRRAATAGSVSPPATVASIQPPSGWGAVIFWGLKVILTAAAEKSRARGPAVGTVARAPNKVWDSNVQRYRGANGQFVSG